MLEYMKMGPEQLLKFLEGYIPVLQVNFDTMLLEMKKKSYDQTNSESETDENDPAPDLGVGGAVQAFREAK